MARRYIGDAVVYILYRGGDVYTGSITVGNRSWVFEDLKAAPVGFGGEGYDSPRAYDAMAAAAVSFGAYYTTRNRGDAPEWAPAPDVADAIEGATAWATDDQGTYFVARSKGGKTTREGR